MRYFVTQHKSFSRSLVVLVAWSLLLLPIVPHHWMISEAQAQSDVSHAHHHTQMSCHTQQHNTQDDCNHCDDSNAGIQCQCLDHLTSTQINHAGHFIFAYFSDPSRQKDFSIPLPDSPFYHHDKPPRHSV